MSPGEGEAITVAPKGQATGIMMVGLQGSGKTTTCAKLARFLQKQGKKPLLVAADMQRPAAVEQLKVLGEQIDVPVFNIPGATPLDICRQAPRAGARLRQARRHHLRHRRPPRDRRAAHGGARRRSRPRASPSNILLVVDAMIGQDAVKTSKAFHDRLDLTGVVLTKLDGDARGGAALVHQGGHRRARPLRRHGRGARQVRGVPPRRHGQPRPRHGRRRRPDEGLRGGRRREEGRREGA